MHHHQTSSILTSIVIMLIWSSSDNGPSWSMRSRHRLHGSIAKHRSSLTKRGIKRPDNVGLTKKATTTKEQKRSQPYENKRGDSMATPSHVCCSLIMFAIGHSATHMSRLEHNCYMAGMACHGSL